MSTEGTSDVPEPGRPGVSSGSLGSTPGPPPKAHKFFDTDAPLQRALAAGGIGSWRIDLHDRKVTLNDQEARILGLGASPLQIRIEDFSGMVHPDDLPRLSQQFWDAGSRGEEIEVEFRIVRPGGEIRWLQAIGGFLQSDDGGVSCMLGIHVDITERKRTEDLLKRLKTRRLLAVEAAEVGDWEYDIDNDKAYWSRKACEQMGLDPDDNPSFQEGLACIHPDDRSDVLDAVEKAVDPTIESDIYHAEFRLVHPGGEIVWVESRGHAIFEHFDKGRRATRLLGAMVDVTERKRAEEELRENRRRLATLIQNLPGMAYRCRNEPDWPFEFISGSEVICGWPAEVLESGEVQWSQLIHPDDRDRLWEEVQQALRRHDHFEVEYRLRHADGSQRWLWEQGTGVFEGDEVVALEGFIADVTDRRKAEEELRDADERKDEFLAMLGHELRNPLMAINSAADLLAEGASNPALISRAQRIISRQSRQMTRLIDGLLDVSRITRGKLEIEPTIVNLVEVVHDLLEDRQEQLASRRLDIVVDAGVEGLFAEVDPVRVRQVFDNLLVNAIKFTDEHDTIRVELCREGDDATVSVQDTGAGIEPTLLPHIFEPFQQAPQDIARSRGGLGLGLALARELVELHGGTIEAYSEGPGKGSKFIVRLPLLDAPDGQDVHEAPDAVKHRSILLVEDNLDVVEVLTLQLEQAGCEVESAFRAADGLEVLRRTRPDVVLCDLGLPETSGYEFATAVREELALDDLPLIALTGYGDPETRQRTLESGFDAHVVKPVDIDQLLAVIQEFSS